MSEIRAAIDNHSPHDELLSYGYQHLLAACELFFVDCFLRQPMKAQAE